MAPSPFISIIIPVRNFERTIDKTFEYLLNVDYLRDRMEIVIADGGSTDKTVDVVKKWQKKYSFIKLVEIPNCPSPAYARNKAFEVVKGEYLLFTDGDCAPDKNWANELIKHLERDKKIAAVGGEVYTYRVDKDNLVEAWCEHFRFNMVSPRYGFIKEGYFPEFQKEPLPVDVAGHKAYFFGTCNVAYRVSAIKEEGASFWSRPTGEDLDFSLHHRKRGWKYYFAPDAKIDHMHRADLPSLLKVWITYGAPHPALIDKYVKKNVLQIVLQFFKSAPIINIPFPIKGFIYLGNFHLMHIFGILGITGLIASFLTRFNPIWLTITAVSFLLTYNFAYKFIYWCISMEPRKHFFTWCKMKYLTNLFFIKGGLKEFGKYKILCVEPSF